MIFRVHFTDRFDGNPQHVDIEAPSPEAARVRFFNMAEVKNKGYRIKKTKVKS